MSDRTLVEMASPTMAGIKTGSLFPCRYGDRNAFLEEIRGYNRRLAPRGLVLIPLKISGGRALLYLVRPDMLKKDFEDENVRSILNAEGYECGNLSRCIRHLKTRLQEERPFPHEIGLFLGYPPEDVQGFIDYGGRACKSCGYWKVYGDVQEAEKQFRRFTRCTGVYMKCLRMGTPFEKLAVRKAV